MKHSFNIEVRTYELDSYNHVNNAVYLQYFEYARMKFLEKIGFDYQALINDGYLLYVTKATISYKHSAFLFDTLTIEVESKKLGAVSGTIVEVACNQHGTICAEAEIGWACVRKETGRPTKLPEKYIVEGLKPQN